MSITLLLNKRIFLLALCFMVGKSIYSAGIYTGKDFILECKDQRYIRNQDICNTAVTQAFASYMVSIELLAGEKLAKCYRSYYPFLEKKSVKDGVLFLTKQYNENPELTPHLLGFGFSVAMYSKYPIPSKCIKFKQSGVLI
ncbi:hypothetical protein Lbru_2228 [Legionella brunensis]|uniref:Uncharacterized protein n=1 Tax=Legionella brunensis TaxID=29422 RepID=A0A0W0SE08_9GAMM|nr:hypothetical protein Lbru_2228 [Legionella brunensis]